MRENSHIITNEEEKQWLIRRNKIYILALDHLKNNKKYISICEAIRYVIFDPEPKPNSYMVYYPEFESFIPSDDMFYDTYYWYPLNLYGKEMRVMILENVIGKTTYMLHNT